MNQGIKQGVTGKITLKKKKKVDMVWDTLNLFHRNINSSLV